jgi:hypothetical protein
VLFLVLAEASDLRHLWQGLERRSDVYERAVSRGTNYFRNEVNENNFGDRQDESLSGGIEDLAS